MSGIANRWFFVKMKIKCGFDIISSRWILVGINSDFFVIDINDIWVHVSLKAIGIPFNIIIYRY